MTVIFPFTECLPSNATFQTPSCVLKKKTALGTDSLCCHTAYFLVPGAEDTCKPVSPFLVCTSSTDLNKAKDSPGGPGAKHLPCNTGTQVQSLVGELRAPTPQLESP